ncbi:MAG: ribosome small subunit-dependent GTPase A [Gammaproteobacteria bacterium]|nr:ribosome small subunit-dependent GTPase A [Gammaproteobacteria bacterium]
MKQADPKKLIRGQVITRHGEILIVEIPDKDSSKQCKVISRRKHGAIVSGDFILLSKEASNTLVVEERLERQSLLSRIDNFGKTKTIAANITQIVVTFSIQPKPSHLLIDRYILAAEMLNIKALLVLNKTDLINDSNKESLLNLLGMYNDIGYESLQICAHDAAGISALQDKLKNETSILVGQSGVGKSSIIKSILPNLNIRIAELSHATGEGKHTTRTSTLHHLPTGGNLIDTPGVRGFTPPLPEKVKLQHGFIEIHQHAKQCRFANCCHINEPNCAVLDAVEKQSISQKRYASYKKLFAEIQQSN